MFESNKTFSGENKSDEIFLVLKEKVERLHHYSDHYFEQNAAADAAQKTADVEAMLAETLRFLDSKKEQVASERRAQYHYLVGRALNVRPQHCPQAQAALSRAVKLDRALVAAWNELGDCYWKKDDVKEARACYEGALQQQRNEVSLRNLSMVARQEKHPSAEKRAESVEQGVTYAKEAVQLNPRDGLSWLVLGNAYIARYFTVQNPDTLKLCMSAYQHALKDPEAECHADLHYNMAIVLKYREQYQGALGALSRASALDPTWPPPRLLEERLLQYLARVQELVALRGRLRARRLAQLLQALDDQQPETRPLASLQEGANPAAVVLGTVACSVHTEDGVPFTFCLVDRAGTCVAVTLYNLAAGKGVIIGDSVAIPQPFLSHISLSYKGKQYQFDSIRVETPSKLKVNGRVLGRDKLASVQLSSSKLAS
ncbi:tetratricopeptide repeat protein 5-like [Bacillus rossius redtenbacheri]|uniref:tetratricopeptide repeat protein 5-like n=1 Tax=Bacillus rossius redtenbacheri TaxID=93214 RepID=UPI002FDE1705